MVVFVPLDDVKVGPVRSLSSVHKAFVSKNKGSSGDKLKSQQAMIVAWVGNPSIHLDTCREVPTQNCRRASAAAGPYTPMMAMLNSLENPTIVLSLRTKRLAVSKRKVGVTNAHFSVALTMWLEGEGMSLVLVSDKNVIVL